MSLYTISKNGINININDDKYNKFFIVFVIFIIIIIHLNRFNNIYISRVIGGVEYCIFNICTIPAEIEISGDFGTGSSDLTSNTMLFRIYKLFNEGKLLHNYIPPYNIPSINGGYLYIKPHIHFNNYKGVNSWIYDNRTKRTKQSFIEMFKHYAEEINNYHQN
jgi:hypothetical protein